jgi:outer membrane murein-binding lipoprotein Lpp
VDAAQVIGWALALGALVVVAVKGWPAIRRATAAASRAVALVDALATLPEDLEFIKGELRENGGGSVKDAVVRTEASVKTLTADVETLTADVGHVKRQAASLKTSIARANRTIKEHIGGQQDESGR